MVEKKIIPKEHEAKLKSIQELYPSVKTFTFDFSKKFDFVPGQIVMFQIKDHDGNTIRRSYSISSAPGKKEIELVMNIIPGGKMTQFLNNLKIGDKLKLSGPYGRFGGDILKSEKDLVFIAAGTGVAPIRSFINHLLKSKFSKKVTLLYGFRHESNYLFKEEFEDLQDQYNNFNLVPTVSQPVNAKHWYGEKGRVTDYISNKFDKTDLDQEFYICGLGQMVKDTRKALLDKGVKPERIHIEIW